MTARANGASGPAPDARHAGRVRDETIDRLDQAMGALGTAAIASMDRRLPWFRAMSAEKNTSAGAPALIWRARSLDPPRLKTSLLPVAFSKLAASSFRQSVRLAAA